MITKENFIKYINRIKELREIEDEINLAGEKLGLFISFADHEQLTMDILTDVFDDFADGWISYFVYELSFGDNWSEGKIRDENGEDIPLRNAGDLYDVLMDSVNED